MDDNFYSLAKDLENAGLTWDPEIGDEVFVRDYATQKLSIIVDSGGMDIVELREAYIWVPTIEQMLSEIESRSATLFHSGIKIEDGKKAYTVIIQSIHGTFESTMDSLREALGVALKNLILKDKVFLSQVC